MNLLEFSDEIFVHHIFPNLELSELNKLKTTCFQFHQLIENYSYSLGKNLGFQYVYHMEDLIHKLEIELSPIRVEFSTLIRFMIHKTHSLIRYSNADSSEIIYELNLELGNKESFLIFLEEWNQLFDQISNKTIVRPFIYSILLENMPSMGLTFQNTDTRILEKLFPKWNSLLVNSFKEKRFSDSDNDEIRTELNTKIFQLLV